MARAKKISPADEAKSELLSAFMVMGMSQSAAEAAVKKTTEIFVEQGRKEERERLLDGPGLSEEVATLIEGLEISVDVSWQGNDPYNSPTEAGYRIFGKVAEVMGSGDSDRSSIVLLVYDSEANFPTSRPGDTVILDWLLSAISPTGYDKTDVAKFELDSALKKKLLTLKGQSPRDALLRAMPAKLRRQAVPHP